MKAFFGVFLFIFLSVCNISLASYLEEKADAFDRYIQAYQLPHGEIVNVYFNEWGQVDNYHGRGDSAMWTSVYMASQCFRYAATKDKQALDNVKYGMQTIERLLYVTGDKGKLARYFYPLNSQIDVKLSKKNKASEYEGYGEMKSYKWIGDTSRDQYSGVMFALGTCYDLVEDINFRKDVRRSVKKIVDNFIKHLWFIYDGNGKIVKGTPFVIPYMSLSFLQIAHHVTGEKKYRKEFKRFYYLYLPSLKLMISKFNVYYEYYAFNLRYLAFYNLVRLEGNNKIKRQLMDIVDDKLWKHTKDHFNSLFIYIYHALKDKDGGHRLREALNSLEEFYGPPNVNRRVINSDRSGIIDKKMYELISWFEKLGLNQWINIDKKQSKYPLPVRERPPTDFVWQRSPYKLDGGSNDGKVYPGVDYLIAYWMGRYYGFVE